MINSWNGLDHAAYFYCLRISGASKKAIETD